MKTPKYIFAALTLGLAAALLAGCSTTSGRIKKNQQLFDSYPVDVQSNIRNGKVDINYTPDMVLMALGEPDRRYGRTTEQGTSEVWAYTSKAPTFSFGLGVGGGGGRTGIGTGAGVTTGGNSDEKVRVVFQEGKVVSVEQLK